MSRNASHTNRTARTSANRTARRLGAVAALTAAAAALPLANAATASAAVAPLAPATAVTAVAASSTSSTSSTLTAAHSFKLSTHTVAFGSHNLGSTTTKKVTFKNTGTKTLHPVQVLSGASSLTLSANTCAAKAVPAGASCAYTLRFAPTAPGPATATLQVLTTEGTPAQNVAISGTGVQQLMEHYFYQYTFTNPPVINGVAAPQSFIGEGRAPAGTYTSGQTIAVYDTTGLNQIGTYRIGTVDNTVPLDATLGQVDVTSYSWGTHTYTAATGLADRPGTTGLGSEAGSIAGLGLDGNPASFNDHQPAVIAYHF